MMAFLPGLRDPEVFGRSVGSRRLMFQRRGLNLGVLASYPLAATDSCESMRIPRNSTQVISKLSSLPSADNGTSSSRLRKTYGPVSTSARFLFLELESSSESFSSIRQNSAQSSLLSVHHGSAGRIVDIGESGLHSHAAYDEAWSRKADVHQDPLLQECLKISGYSSINSCSSI